MVGDVVPKLMCVENPTFITCQGEGPLAGTPSLFIRLSGCNLRCVWRTPGGETQCDTPYASYAPERRMLAIDELLDDVREVVDTWGIHHVVITGGEPTIQHIEDLTIRIRDEFPSVVMTVETNGTNPKSLPGVQWIALSPKIHGIVDQQNGFQYSVEHLAQQIVRMRMMNPQAILFLKVVVANPQDTAILKMFLKGVRREAASAGLAWDVPVMLMPAGQTNEELERTARFAWSEAIANGWRYCDRVHVRVFGKERNR